MLQVGADIYCDTSLIARELERRYPDPTLFPGGGRGLALALAAWAERFFDAGSSLAMGLNDQLPAELLKDRQAFFSYMDFGSFRSAGAACVLRRCSRTPNSSRSNSPTVAPF